jgi:tetratricopeptide (TPR) repeat protein
MAPADDSSAATRPNEPIRPGPPGASPTGANETAAEGITNRPLDAAAVARAIRGLDRCLAALILALVFLLSSFAIQNTDFWMHLATGRALAQGTYDVWSGTDPFSYTTANTPWINHAWLFDAAIYPLYQLLGGEGLALLRAGAGVILAVVLFQVRRRGQSLWAPAVSAGLALLVLSPRFNFQPSMLSCIFLGITLLVLLTPGSIRRLWLLPPLFLLWVNVDQWFLLGPLAVGLFLLGAWLQPAPAADQEARRQRCKMLGLVLVVGIGACLVNPFGLRALVLPPELAYLVLKATGPQSSAWLAGGATLHELASVDPGFVPYFSPLNSRFLSQPSVGLNVAGLAYFVLLALGLVSFLLNGLVPGAGEDRSTPVDFWSRGFLWLVFAGLSLLLTQLIPFFAVAAGPITALNLQDFARRRFGTGARADGGWRLWSLGGRVLTALACLVLVFLDWPGWLHAAPDEPRLTHRVAWRVYESPTLVQAARKVAELQRSGQLRHGFNYVPDIANYFSWFCPEAKGFMDHRFALFPGVASEYAQVRSALRELGEHFQQLQRNPRAPVPTRHWEAIFRARDINYVVLTGGQSERALALLALSLWLNRPDWAPLYTDGRTSIFAWKVGGPTDRFAGIELDFNREAFGRVPEDRRAPLQGPELPEEPPGFWLRYWVGRPIEPLAALTSRHTIQIYQLLAQSWIQAYFPAWQVLSWAGPVGTTAVVPGSVAGPAATAGFVHLPRDMLLYKNRLGQTFLRPQDYGPPGAPILAVRDARRAVAASPQEPNSHLSVADGYQALWKNQEQHWVPRQPLGGPVAFADVQLLDRQTIRQIQLTTALNHVVSLEEDQPDPALADIHWELAQIYLRMHYLDVALEHLARAHDIVNHIQPPPELKMVFDRRREQFESIFKNVGEEVKKRRAHYDLQAARPGLTILGKFAIALLEPYKTTDENNRATEDRRGLGLARLGLDLLRQANISQMTEQEKQAYANLDFRLLLTMGRVREAREGLVPGLRNLLGPAYDQVEVVLGAATGDYARADQALAALEKQVAEVSKVLRDKRARAAAEFRPWLISLLALDSPAHTQLIVRAALNLLQQKIAYVDSRAFEVPTLGSTASLRSLRGLLALEQGDTKAAATHFRAALRQAGPSEPFPDRPIVERYLQLLTRP